MTQNPQIEALKPCPFCGGTFVAQGASRDYISVWCDCGARGPEVKFPENCDPLPPIYECHAAWNRRASQEAAAPSEEPVVEEAAKRMVDAWCRAPRGTPDWNAEWARKRSQYLKQASAVLSTTPATFFDRIEARLAKEAMVRKLWQELLEKDDRTSPADYPDMALITFEEFAAFASPAVAPVAPAQKPVAWQTRQKPTGANHWGDWHFGKMTADREGWDVEERPLYASPAAAPVAVSVKDMLERCTARDGKETAAQIEAEVTARLEPDAFSVAKQTFRAFAASWEGSIAVAIAAYLDARILSSIIPATRGGEAVKRLRSQLDGAHPNHKTMFVYVDDLRAALAALAQDTDATPPSDTEEKAL